MTAENNKIKYVLVKQGYRFVGNHSAVKICHWAKQRLRNKGGCYKEKFYSIESHRCCQMTPCFTCSNQCVHCWREMLSHTGIKISEPIDDPTEIINGCIEGQRKLLSGFGGRKGIDKNKLKEAQDIKHFAISLTGEPFLYPKLNELIKELHDRRITTFLVTNGMYPEKIKNLNSLPTQFYLSVNAPNKELFNKIECSLHSDGWERLQKTLSLIPDLTKKTRTCLRFTIVKDLNMVEPEIWAEIISKAKAMFVEVKAYMFLGSSRQRLKKENMPFHYEIKNFAEEICKHCDYKIVDEHEPSRVVLLMRRDDKGEKRKLFV